ncbi:hypothetical protein STEG23_007447, partial [Scotinomys teguina]
KSSPFEHAPNKINASPFIRVKPGNKTEHNMDPEKKLNVLSMNLEEAVIKTTRTFNIKEYWMSSNAFSASPEITM